MASGGELTLLDAVVVGAGPWYVPRWERWQREPVGKLGSVPALHLLSQLPSAHRRSERRICTVGVRNSTSSNDEEQVSERMLFCRTV